MDEFMSEAEKWEAVKIWLKQSGGWIVGGVAVGVVGIFIWRWWGTHTTDVALDAAAKYDEIVQVFDKGDRAHGGALIEELRRDYGSSPYVDQANLIAARAFVQAGELDEGAKRLQAVLEHTKDDELSLVARERLARVQIAQNKPDEALKTLDGAQPGAFEPRFQEVRGDAYYAKGDTAEALKAYRAARAGAIGGADTELLDLKINDLSTGAMPAPAASSLE